MIRIGLSAEEKQAVIDDYLQENPDIKKTLILYPAKFRTEYQPPEGVKIEYVEWSDIIMYKFFYRLLEEINDSYLIVVDELMRTQNRSELTYNCAHHYLNQTTHRIIFEYFPFIEDEADFMILLDFAHKGRYKGRGFAPYMLKDEDVKMKYQKINFTVKTIPTTPGIREKYEQRKESLFSGLGQKDPDTIPRNLHLFVGDFKRPFINPPVPHVARNGRFGLENITTYKDAGMVKRGKTPGQLSLMDEPSLDFIIIDFPHRRIDMNDFLKTTKARILQFLSSGLAVDEYYRKEFESWIGRIEAFYAQASLHK